MQQDNGGSCAIRLAIDIGLELPAFDDIKEFDPDDDESPRTEIMPRLWVGGERAARALRDIEGWKLICVREADCLDSNNVFHLPLLRRESGGHPGKTVLEELAETIDAALGTGNEVLVHCWQGMERSPLVVAWWLCTRQQMSLDAAYALLKRLRPQVDDCRDWLTDRARKALDRADSQAKEF